MNEYVPELSEEVQVLPTSSDGFRHSTCWVVVGNNGVEDEGKAATVIEIGFPSPHF